MKNKITKMLYLIVCNGRKYHYIFFWGGGIVASLEYTAFIIAQLLWVERCKH